MNEKESSVWVVTELWIFRFWFSAPDCERRVNNSDITYWISSEMYGGLKSLQTAMSFQPCRPLSLTYFFSFFRASYQSHATYIHDLLKDSDEPLWDGCTNHSKLSAVAHVVTIKSNHGLSEAGYDKIIVLPEGNRLKENFYAAKSMMKPLGLGYYCLYCYNCYCWIYVKNVSL